MAPEGSNIFLFGSSFGTSFHSKQWLSLDPCGMFGVFCSWFFHIYALIVVSTHLVSNSVAAIIIYLVLYIPAAFLAMASLYKVWITDPGAVPLGARPLTIVRRASADSLGNQNSSSGHGAAAVAAAVASETEKQQQQQQHAQLQQVCSQRAIRRCHKCNDNYKPPRAHHDSVTGRCIVKFDHFCPWVGNAVGALNHKFFCLFLFYSMITCCISLLLLFMRAIHCGYTVDPENGYGGQDRSLGAAATVAATATATALVEFDEDALLPPLTGDGEGLDRHLMRTTFYKYPECDSHFYGSKYVLGLAICAVIFLIFTCSMGCEQMEAVETGKGKIARMKMRVGQAGTEFSRVTEEFNEMFGGDSPELALHWFLPFDDVRFPQGMKKVVLGYEWDDSFDPEPYEPVAVEMQHMEAGMPLPNGAGGAGATTTTTTRDVLLLDDSASVHSETSATSLKNRKSPPSKTMD